MQKSPFVPHLPRNNVRLLRGFLVIWILSCVPMFSLVAQSLSAVNLSKLAVSQPAANHYDVVALRIEFQSDTTSFTSGTGRFSEALFDTLSPRIDPFPHDAAYFDAHLSFLKNYVAKVSDNKTTITTHLIDEVVQVSQTMANYSPTGREPDQPAERQKLINLVDEAWQLADQNTSLDVSGFDPATTIFILFHAGVGRDLELTGTSLNRTPEDLPSLYFSEQSLSENLPALPVFKGLPVSQTIVLPETESRVGYDFINRKEFLLELSINGLLTVSFFNALGVPDLFNTSDGQSAIGPFGVMDPEGFFAYAGLFVPEPSAWTKKYLGWADIIVESPTNTVVNIELPAGGTNTNTVAQIPISESEYFLVENRYRDLDNDGLHVQVWKDNQTTEVVFENGQVDFNNLNQDAFEGGVIVSVDDYDWALPGGLDSDDNDLMGGMLVWHIDENKINAGLLDNSVNADNQWRGIDLEEADGAQDIGFPPLNPLGPAVHRGTPFDFFYQDNPVTVITEFGTSIQLYENRFASDTYPNNLNNAGGHTFIQLEDFTLPGQIASFNLSIESVESTVAPILGLKDTNLRDTLFSKAIALNFNRNIVVFNDSTASVIDTFGVILASFDQLIAAPVIWGDSLAFIRDGLSGHELVVASLTDERVIALPAEISSAALAGTLVIFNDQIVFLLDDETVAIYNRTTGFSTQLADIGSPIGLLAGGENLFILGRSGATSLDGSLNWDYTISQEDEVGRPAGGRDEKGVLLAVPMVNSASVMVLTDESTVEIWSIRDAIQTFDLTDGSLGEVAVANLFENEDLSVVATFGSYLVGFNRGGSVKSAFPIKFPAQLSTTPLIVKNADGNPMILAGGETGQLYGVELTDKVRDLVGFPLAVGDIVSGAVLATETGVFAASENGFLSGWRWSDTGNEVIVGGDRRFVTVSVDTENSAGGNDLLIDSETYNWPNPTADEGTWVRFGTTSDATIKIKILDPSGQLVADLDGGLISAGEIVEIFWPANVASGIYYARVQAESTNGSTASKIIKIAVIR